MATVSHSEVNALLSCERKHFYQYGLEIDRITTSDALRIGRMGHDALEIIWQDAIDGVDEATTKLKLVDFYMTQTDIELVVNVKRALDWYFKVQPLAGYEILAFEKEMVLEVTGDLSYPFIPDLIVRNVATGRMIVIDTKFVYNFYSDTEVALSSQLPKYVAALRAMGHDIYDAAYLQFRNRGLKEQTAANMVRFQMLGLTDERVKRSFIEQGRAMERVLEIKSQPLEVWSANALRTSSTFVCDRCPMASLCAAELRSPSEAQLILDSEYKKRERRVFKETTND